MSALAFLSDNLTSLLAQVGGASQLESWQFLIKCLTWDIFLACILWSFGKSLLHRHRADGTGVPTTAFTWADNTIAICMCLSMLLVHVSTFPIFSLFILFRMFTPPVKTMYQWRLPAAWRIVAWIVGISVAVRLGAGLLEYGGITEWFCERTGAPEEQEVIQKWTRSDFGDRLNIALSAVLLAPVLEEICFRGYLYPLLKRYLPPLCANIGISFFFAFVHNSMGQALPLALIGFLLTLCYERTQNLLVPMMAHAAFNATTILLLVLS